jgi:predicted permease
VRKALGAGRGRIAGQFLADAAVLSGAGALAGLLLAVAGTALLVRLVPFDLPRLHEVSVDGSVIAFTALLAFAIGAFLALLPVLQERGSLRSALASSGRTATGSAAGRRTRDVLASLEIAAALAVVVSAGLMARTLANLHTIDPGFDATSALTFELSLPPASYPAPPDVWNFHLAVRDRLLAIPGVIEAGAVENLPLTGYSSVNPLTAAGSESVADPNPPAVQLRGVTPGYFEAAGIPLLEGRPLEMSDISGRTGAVLVSRSLANRLFAGRSVVGERVYPTAIPAGTPASEVSWFTITGVVGDVPPHHLNDAPHETAYFAIAGNGENGPTMWSTRRLVWVVRTGVPPLSIVEAVRRSMATLDPGLPLAAVTTLDALVDNARAPTSFNLLLLGLAALVAGLLGVVGVYGVLSYAMTQRRGEIGIRMAMGATRTDISGLVLRHALRIATAGTLAGVAAALVTTRLMTSMLVGVEPHDPRTFLLSAFVLFAVAILAAWLPARRASCRSPAEVLHS